MIALLLMAATVTSSTADTTVRLSRGTTVEISSFSQAVVVTGADGDDLTVTGADVELHAQRVDIEGRMFGRGSDGPIRVRVPTWARVVIDAVNGSITVHNAPNDLEVEAVNGRLEVTGGRGQLTLSALGEIVVTDFRGTHLRIEGLSGNIMIRGATGTLSVESVNGSITLERVVTQDAAFATTNGSIRWEGALDPAGRYRFESHNGNVELRVPNDLNARIQLETFMGGLSSEIPATITGADKTRGGAPLERHITAVYGRGQAAVDIGTFNGGVRVRRLGSK